MIATGHDPKPMSEYCENWLLRLKREAFPADQINPGARWKLVADGYIEVVQRPSPYKVDRSKPRSFVAITAAGLAYLETLK